MDKAGRRMAGWLGGLAAASVMGAMSPPPRGAARPPGGDCLACHAIEKTLSHPVDVYPTMAVPPHFHLPDGRITCTTCHEAPADGGHPREGAIAGSACDECHDPLRGIADLHGATLGRAHLLWPGRAPERHGAAVGFAGLDPDSESCLACHDGAVARAPGMRLGSGEPVSAARIFGGRHPIGVEQRPRGAGDHLVAPSLLDPRIRLFDGRVGCGSCHSPYAGGEALLVMSNERSALCLSCHDF